MRFLHTGDWHVGRSIAGRSRAEEHEDVLTELTQVARDAAVDAVLVAGDVFDTAAPSAEAERIVYSALLGLSEVAPVIVIPGNHDNERRLAAIAPLFGHVNVTIHPYVVRECMTFEARDEVAKIALLPWLSQRYVVKADQLMAKDAAELTGDYAGRLRRVIETLTAQFRDDTVNLVLGHLTIAGGGMGGGERTAQTIHDYWIDATAFPATAHYVALGHLHKKQQLPGPCPVWYCGSPMQLDFSDTEANKNALIVEASPGTPARVEEVELTRGRRLRTISGTLADLTNLQDQTGDDYLRVIVREAARVGLSDEVREMFPHAVKVVVESSFEPSPTERISHRDRTPHELFETYLETKGVDDERLVALFDELYEEAHETDAA